MSAIIKNIFLPEKVGTNYLFAKTVVAVSIGKTTITATKSVLKGHETTVKLIVEEKIEQGASEESETVRISNTLKTVFDKIGSYDELHAVISSSLVVFKELKVPFLSREKISMIIGFEIEPLLPFALRDAVVDFVITKQHVEEKSSELLVTAVQKQHIADLVALFEPIGIKPDVVTVDTIALYNLYSIIPAYNQLTGGTALIDIGLYSTRITLIINAQLKMIRTLPKGIIAVTKKAAAELNVTPNEAMEKLIRFGLESTESPDDAQKMDGAFGSLWDDIMFTFTSFTAQFLDRNPMTKVILLGEGSLIKGIIESFSKKIKTPCEMFAIDALQEVKNFDISNDVVITPVNLVSVSATIPSEFTQDYTLLYKEVSKVDNVTMIKQLIVLIVLSIGLFAALITHYSVQIHKLKKEIESSQQEALTALKTKFKNLEDEKKLVDAIDAAEDEVKTQKERWFAFSNQSRASFLQYLLELTSKIDVKTIGLDVEQISMAEQELTLKARVKDYEALKILERELGQSPLFSYVAPQEDLQFSMKITLAPRAEEI